MSHLLGLGGVPRRLGRRAGLASRIAAWVRLADVCKNHPPLPSVFFFFFDVARIDAVRGCDILLLIVLTANFIVLI